MRGVKLPKKSAIWKTFWGGFTPREIFVTISLFIVKVQNLIFWASNLK